MPDKLKDEKRLSESCLKDAKEDSRVLEKLSNIQMRIENGFCKIEHEMVARSRHHSKVHGQNLKEEYRSLKKQVWSMLKKNDKLKGQGLKKVLSSHLGQVDFPMEQVTFPA